MKEITMTKEQALEFVGSLRNSAIGEQDRELEIKLALIWEFVNESDISKAILK